MNVREYLDTVVRPNMADLDADYSDMRHALNAVHSVDALAAHILATVGAAKLGLKAGADDSDYRGKLARENADFRLLRDVAKAIKHVKLTRGKPEERIVTGADQLETRGRGWGEGLCGDGRYGGPSQPVVTTDSGELRVLETVLQNALAHLESEMERLGLLARESESWPLSGHAADRP